MGLSPYMQYFGIGSTKNMPSREMPTLLVITVAKK